MPVKPFEGHSDDGVVPTVDDDALSEHPGIGAVTLPVPVRDDRHPLRVAGAFFVRLEGAPDRQTGAERLEEVGGDRERHRPMRRVSFGHPDEPDASREQVREDVVVLPDVQVVRVREASIPVRAHEVLAVEADELPRNLLRRARTQKQLIHEGEHRSIRADTEREDEHGDAGEGRFARQHAEPVANVLDDRRQHVSDARHLQKPLQPTDRRSESMTADVPEKQKRLSPVPATRLPPAVDAPPPLESFGQISEDILPLRDRQLGGDQPRCPERRRLHRADSSTCSSPSHIANRAFPDSRSRLSPSGVNS